MKLKIDPDHPLAKGLIGCWVPGVSFGIDLTGNTKDLTPHTNDPSGLSSLSRVASEGPAMGTLGSTGFRSNLSGNAPASMYNATAISLYFRADRNGLANANNGQVQLVTINYDNTGGPLYHVFGTQNFAGGDYATIRNYWNDGSNYQSGNSVSFEQDGTMSALSTFKVGGNAVLYKNGVAADTVAFGATPPAHGTLPQLNINGWQDVTRLGAALVYLACIWDRELTAYEATLLDADPYGFLIPDEGEWAVARSTAAATFRAAWAMDSNPPVLGTGNF